MSCGRKRTYFPEKDMSTFSPARHRDRLFQFDCTLPNEIGPSVSKDSLSTVDEDDDDDCVTQKLRHRIFRPRFESSREFELTWNNPEEILQISTKYQDGRASTKFRRFFLTITLLCCAILAIFQSQIVKGSSRWQRFLKEEAPRMREQIQLTELGNDFTIRLSGTRIDLIQQSLDLYSRCPFVKEVQIDFQGTRQAPQSVLSHDSGKAAVVGKSSTSSVFLLSEGLVFTCQEIERAFNTWKLDPQGIVGFFAYRQSPTESTTNDGFDIGIQPVKSGIGSYSLVSDRAAFVHQIFIDELPLDLQRSCCDAMLSLLVSVVTSKSAVVLTADARNISDEGVSSFTLRGGSDEPTGCTMSCSRDWMAVARDLKDVPSQEAFYVGEVMRTNTVLSM